MIFFDDIFFKGIRCEVKKMKTICLRHTEVSSKCEAEDKLSLSSRRLDHTLIFSGRPCE